MKKQIFRILGFTLALSLMACSDGRLLNEMQGQRISLQVSALSSQTKATQDGVTALNENKINSVYYFLYRKDVTDEAPVLKGFFANVNLNGTSKTFDIPVSASDVLTSLFPAGVQKCHAYIIANPPSSVVSFLEGSPTYEELREKVITAGFDSPDQPDSFVMFHDGEVTLSSRTAKIAATIDAPLKRIADKFTFKVNIENEYTDSSTGKIYEPIPGSVNVTLMNGIKKSNLSGDFGLLSSVHGQVLGSDFFESAPIYLDQTVSDQYERTSSKALYSYPMVWDFTDPHEPYVLFELRWKEKGSSGSGTPYYYKMMLSIKEIESNSWYNIIATLDILGSLERTAPLVMFTNATYKVLDWRDAYDTSTGTGNVDADIKDARYLVVDQTEYTIHDQDELSIPFSSSHECVVEVTAKKYNKSTGLYDVDVPNPGTYTFNGNVLEMTHQLNNTIGSGLDILPYKFNIKLYHKADAGQAATQYKSEYYADIVVIQYPAIYITVEKNSCDHNKISGRNWGIVDARTYTEKGWVFVNGSQETNSSYYGGVQGAEVGSGWFGGTGNSSVYMTVITVGKLPEGNYVLGDPRTDSYDTNSSTYGTASKNTVYEKSGTSRTLKYYYPADTEKSKFIAPELRSTSGHARLPSGNTLTYDNAKKRCATFQEDGYPAGRWRLPTQSEIEFIASLSNLGLVDQMFTTGQNYWCSNGYAYINSNGTVQITPDTNASGRYVRCVYDEWYWKEVDKAFNTGVIKTSNDGSRSGSPNPASEFYWGDIRRSDFQYR